MFYILLNALLILVVKAQLTVLESSYSTTVPPAVISPSAVATIENVNSLATYKTISYVPKTTISMAQVCNL